MKRVFAGLILSTFVLTACVTLGPEQRSRLSGTVEIAAQLPPAEIKAAADAGDGHAQLSYSLVLRYGLNHTPTNASLADVYRGRAVASRGSTTTAIYVPAAGKMPGHTQLISVPKYDVSEVEARSRRNVPPSLTRRQSPLIRWRAAALKTMRTCSNCGQKPSRKVSS
jgi:hypothetical protein